MKSLFSLVLVLGLPTVSFADEVERIQQLLTADPRFDSVRLAATGKDRFASRMIMSPYIPALCKKVDCYTNTDGEFTGDAAIELAKLRLKNIDESNKRYAQALVDLQKVLENCSKEVSEVHALKNPESCLQEISCNGKDAEKIMELFDEHNEFEQQVPRVHRELLPEEKIIAGVDITPALKEPFQNHDVPSYHMDYEPTRFNIGRALYSSLSNSANKSLLPKKVQRDTKTAIAFYEGSIPDGIMTLRGLSCVKEVVMKEDEVKKSEASCQIFIGNKKADVKNKDVKSCLKKEKVEVEEELGFFAKLFKRKQDKVHVNDSERSNIKDAASIKEQSQSEIKNSKASER